MCKIPVCYHHTVSGKEHFGSGAVVGSGCGGSTNLCGFSAKPKKDEKSRWGTAAKSRRNEAEQTGLLPTFVAKPLKPCALDICVEEISGTMTKEAVDVNGFWL